MLEEEVSGTAPNVLGANQSPWHPGGGCNCPSCKQGSSAALRGGRRAAECVAWQLEQVHWVTQIRSHIKAREGARGLVCSGLVWCCSGCDGAVSLCGFPGICLF